MFGRVDAARMEFPAASSQTQIIKKESSPRLVSPQMIGAIDYPDDIALRGDRYADNRYEVLQTALKDGLLRARLLWHNHFRESPIYQEQPQ